MHPLFAHRWAFLWLQVACSSLGLVFAAFLSLSELMPLLSALLLCLPLSLISSFYLSSAFYVSRAQTMNRHRLLRVILSYASVCSVSALIFASLVVSWDRLLNWAFNHYQSLQSSGLHPGVYIAIGLILYLLALLGFDLNLTIERLRQSERQAAQAQLIAREAELHALRNQIDPHFLFNALNSISALTSFDAVAARSMTIALADFFRLSLSTSQSEKISVQQELKVCEHFLAVEKIRYEEKLQTQIEIEDGLEQALLPPMLLQPLFENAIKHGIRLLTQGGKIRLRISRRFDSLILQISNPCPPSAAAASDSGIGLVNLQQRLQTIYHDQARVSWQVRDLEFNLEVILPLEWSKDEN